MKYRTRIYYTEAQKTLMWDRWQKGESLSSIARFFGRHHSSVEGILKQTGGIRPRRRPRRALTLSEREEISRDVVAGCSIRSIARTLGRAPSTVSREIRRNGGTSSQVTAGTVQVSDLGARQGNGRSQTLQSRYQYSGLLLRSTKPLAARLQRKHQRTAPTVLPERNGSVKRPPKQIECCGQTVKRTTQKNARL